MLRHGMFLDDGSLSLLEDMECGYRLAQHGMKLRFHPQARGRHVHKMKREWVASKGYNTGQAQYRLAMKVPDIAVKERFGILSRDLPPLTLFKRICRRAAFYFVDTPLTSAVLRLLGAEGDERSRVTDLYYYLTFRRNMLAGYRAIAEEAKRKRERPDALENGAEA